MTVSHLRNFLGYAEARVNVQNNIHLEHIFALYIYSNAYHESISLPIEPVIFGVSGRTGAKYKFFTESWLHNIVNTVFKKFRLVFK